jgi:hypothetical protein
MNESIIPTERHFTACASLAALGVHVSYLDLFGPIREGVHIAQKTVKHSPTDKLYDAFISRLSGGHGLVEITTCLRADPTLQAAFGRSRCAEQSVVQDTLNACTVENVTQMEQAMNMIYRKLSRGSRHDYRAGLHVLDVDMSGMPCGKKAAFARHRVFRQPAQSAWATVGPGVGQPLRGHRGGSALYWQNTTYQREASLDAGR